MRIGNRTRVQSCRHQSRNVRHIYHKICADFVRNLTETLKVNSSCISACARNDELGFTPEPRGAPQGDAADPAERLASRAGAEELEEMVRGLREPYGRIAVLYFLEHRDTAQIAQLVGRPPATVSSQLWRAKLLLRQQITERRLKE